MGKRPRCPVCRSREWHKESSSGLLVCSEGHVLQDYRTETTQTANVNSQHVLRRRTLKSTRIVHTRTKANESLYHGARARYFYFECLQLLLRKQIAALTAAWGLPREFETVCRDLWALHLSLLPRPPPAEPYLHAQGLGDDASDGSTPSASDKDGEDRQEEDEEGKGESEGESEVESEADTLLEDLLREPSQSESDDDSAEAAPPNTKPAAVGGRQRRNRYEVPLSNIAVLALACWTLRLPVMYLDLIRLIEAYTLPYLDPVRLLPPEMTRHLAKQTTLALSPHFPPSVAALHALTSRLARLCWAEYGIHTPEVNAAPLLWRIVRALRGSAALYALTKTIAGVLSLPLTLHPSLAPALVRRKRTDPRRHQSDNVPPEVALVGAVIVVLKLVYGLDGTPRCPADPADPACALPCLEDYLARLREATPGPGLFSARCHAVATELDGAQLDAYLAFCERALLGGNVTDKTVTEFFPLAVEEEASAGRMRAGGEDGRRDVAEDDEPERGAMMRPNLPQAGSGLMEPASRVRVYNTLDVLGTVAEEYGTVLRAGADVVGVGEDDVGRVVERFERRLVTWAERSKKQHGGTC